MSPKEASRFNAPHLDRKAEDLSAPPSVHELAHLGCSHSRASRELRCMSSDCCAGAAVSVLRKTTGRGSWVILHRTTEYNSVGPYKGLPLLSIPAPIFRGIARSMSYVPCLWADTHAL